MNAGEEVSRFWIPLGAQVSLDEFGYLPDPEDEAGRYGNNQVRTISEQAQEQCLVLLGESGSGKSTCLKQHLDSDAAGSPTRLWIDLKKYGGEERLARMVFRDNQIVQDWLQGDGTLIMTFDSFDECQLGIHTLAPLLNEELARLPIGRLQLRLISRPTSWSDTMQDALQSIWPNTRTLEILPLRRKDVAATAEANGLDASLFLDAIEKQHLQPLCLRPMTLNFLVKRFKQGQELTDRTDELYEDGSLQLLDEPNPTPRRAAHRTKMSTAQRLEFAGQIAATMVLCGRSVISEREADQELVAEVVTPSDLFPTGHVGAQQFKREELPEILDTGMFVSAGPGLLTFCHRSFAEYLAARYLANRLSGQQALGLILHEGDRQRVVPQLAGTAAWLGRLQHEFLATLISLDPQLALKSGLQEGPEEIRAEATRTLLESYESAAAFDDDYQLRSFYSELRHQALGAQLKAFICDDSYKPETRAVAIAIASECELVDLSDFIISVVLDPAAPYLVRTEAATAARRVVPREALHRIEPVLESERHEDPDDELFGIALSTLYPDDLDPSRLFSILRSPFRENLFGTYALFLSDLAERLPANSFSEAIDWTIQQPATWALNFHISELLTEILRRANRLIDSNPGLKPKFAEALMKRAELYEHDLVSLVLPPEDAALPAERRRLASILMVHAAASDKLSFLLAAFLLNQGDTQWLVGEYRRTDSEAERHNIVEALNRLVFFDSIDENQVERLDSILTLAQDYPQASKALALWTAPIQIKSPEADEARGALQARLRLSAPARSTSPAKPAFSRAAVLDHWLARLRTDEAEAWSGAAATLIADGKTGRYQGLDVEVSGSDGWREQSDAVKTELIIAATDYVKKMVPPEKWSLGEEIPGAAVSGYRAFSLLADVASEPLAALEPGVWARWAETILALRPISSERARMRHKELISLAHQAARGCVEQAIRTLFEASRRPDGRCQFVRSLAGILDDHVAVLIAEELRHLDIPVDAIRTAFDGLLPQDKNSQIFKLAVSMATGAEAVPKDRRVVAATVLLVSQPRDSFDSVWPTLKGDVRIRVLEAVAARHGGTPFTSELVPEAAAKVFDALVRHGASDYQVESLEFRFMSPGDHISRLRYAVLSELTDRGTRASSDAVADLSARFPGHTHLAWSAARAHKATLLQTWQPPSPRHLMELVQSAERRFVSTEAQLVDVVIAALGRVQTQLQGSTAEAGLLWNHLNPKNKKKTDKRYSPKDENALSDYLKNRLIEVILERGIIVNREVEIRGASARTDILIEATSGLADGVVRTIIEVKGCWNRDIPGSMTAQLRDRYLLQDYCSEGVYLVGWYLCPSWDKDDYRKQDCERQGWNTIADARLALETFAASNAVPRRRIRTQVLDLSI